MRELNCLDTNNLDRDLGERLHDVGDDVVHADGHVDVDCLLYLNDLVLVHVPRHLDLLLNNLVKIVRYRTFGTSII